MLGDLKQRHAELSRSYEQLLANLNATNGAKVEVERLIAQLEQSAAAQIVEFTPPKTKRGPKPGKRRVPAAAVNTEYANDVVRDAE